MQSVYLTESNWLERLSHTGTERKKIHKTPPHTERQRDRNRGGRKRETERENDRLHCFYKFLSPNRSV